MSLYVVPSANSHFIVEKFSKPTALFDIARNRSTLLTLLQCSLAFEKAKAVIFLSDASLEYSFSEEETWGTACKFQCIL